MLSGCYTSHITAPHQPYAPLLDHAGQLDISARAGSMTTNGSTLAAQVAYAPVDHLVIAASFDADFDHEDEFYSETHVGGGVAIGTFTRTDVLRLEAMIGMNGGHAEGSGFRCSADPDQPDEPCVDERFFLSGPYVQPFLQGTVGFEVPFFELAGGLRLETQVTEVDAVGELGTRETSTHVRSLITPFLTIRIPVEFIRFEIMAGMPFSMNGNIGPLEGTTESSAYFYLVGGIGFQFDTIEPAPEEPPRYYREQPIVM